MLKSFPADAPAEWETSPEGNFVGGSGLKLRTEDIAKLGQLYLQKGIWAGKRLIPEDGGGGAPTCRPS